jgi:hypothetical protein
LSVRSPDEIITNNFSLEYIESERYINTDCLMGDLIEILENELEHYRILVNMLINQRKCFADGNIASFEEINKQQGTMVLKIKTLEEARKSAIFQLSQWLGLPQEGLTLSKLSDLMDDPYKIQLDILRDDIQSTIKNLENLRESNAYLVQHALHYVSGVLRIFVSSRSSNIKYSNNGQLEYNQKTGKLVSGWG